VKLVKSSHGSLPVEVLLGLDSATEKDVQNRKSHHELHHEAFHAEHGDDAEHHHDHDDFESFVVSGGVVSNRKQLIAGLARVIEQHDILRLKGFVAIKDKPMRLVVQAVGNRVDHYFDREWNSGETLSSRLVVIGLDGLDQKAISKQISNLLA
jgi:cobalamin biosynthesis protein CobW